MSDSTLSPNMSLPVPTVGSATGPIWANLIDQCLAIIDAHTHLAGSGVQITPAAININSDLTFGITNNAIDLRSTRYTAQSVAIPATGSDLGCLYVAGVDLYYNDKSGNQIRITQSGNVAGSTGTITGLPSGTASAAYASGSGSFVFQQATSTAANLDVGSIAIRYPGSYTTPSGNYIQLQAPSSLASGYAFTLPSSTPASSGAWVTSDTSGVLSYTNVDNSTVEINSATLRVKASGITSNELGTDSVTWTKRAPRTVSTTGTGTSGQIVISASNSGGFSQIVNSYTDVTNLTVTLATRGGPVKLWLQSGTSDSTGMSLQSGSSNGFYIKYLNTTSSTFYITGGVTGGGVTGAPQGVTDYSVAGTAGTYTWKVQVINNLAGATVSVTKAFLFAQEID